MFINHLKSLGGEFIPLVYPVSLLPPPPIPQLTVLSYPSEGLRGFLWLDERHGIWHKVCVSRVLELS